MNRIVYVFTFFELLNELQIFGLYILHFYLSLSSSSSTPVIACPTSNYMHVTGLSDSDGELYKLALFSSVRQMPSVSTHGEWPEGHSDNPFDKFSLFLIRPCKQLI